MPGASSRGRARQLNRPPRGPAETGTGREGGSWSFDFYSDVKNTVYAPEGGRHHG
jgi:hypothetical protein